MGTNIPKLRWDLGDLGRANGNWILEKYFQFRQFFRQRRLSDFSKFIDKRERER